MFFFPKHVCEWKKVIEPLIVFKEKQVLKSILFLMRTGCVFINVSESLQGIMAFAHQVCIIFLDALFNLSFDNNPKEISHTEPDAYYCSVVKINREEMEPENTETDTQDDTYSMILPIISLFVTPFCQILPVLPSHSSFQ